jgi:hypothetical protein
MPDIFITILVDRRNRPLIEARSLEEPDDVAVAQLAGTVKRFGLGEAGDIICAEARACRCCGCTDAQACPGGCSWVDPDLCSQCARAGHVARAPALVLP